MDILNVIETFGVPVAMSIAFGFFIWKQNKWIQDELKDEMDESFDRLEWIIIKLIDAQKIALGEQKEIKASYRAIVEILASLSGNGLKEKFMSRRKDY